MRLFLRAIAFCPTACACRALASPLANASELFQADDAHALRLSMCDNLAREFVVDVAHPAVLFALACAHRAHLIRLLQLLAAGVEAATHHPLVAPVAQVARALSLQHG